jgi:hypothetical protein
MTRVPLAAAVTGDPEHKNKNDQDDLTHSP